MEPWALCVLSLVQTGQEGSSMLGTGRSHALPDAAWCKCTQRVLILCREIRQATSVDKTPFLEKTYQVSWKDGLKIQCNCINKLKKKTKEGKVFKPHIQILLVKHTYLDVASGSFSLINVRSVFHCLRKFFFFFLDVSGMLLFTCT